jgi:hypothetical protein
MAAEVAIVNILSNSTPVAITALGGVTGTSAKVHMGRLPISETLPAISVIRNSTVPSDTKNEVSKLDEERIIVAIHALNYKSAYTISAAVRLALDDIQATNYTVGADTIQIDHIWFAEENYFIDENVDKSIDTFEQDYLVRVKR